MTWALLGPRVGILCLRSGGDGRDRRRQKVVPHPGIAREVPASIVLDSETWKVLGVEAGVGDSDRHRAPSHRPLDSIFIVGCLVH